MKVTKRSTLLASAFLAWALAPASAVAQSGIALYISAPGVQTAEDSGLKGTPIISTETFNGSSTGAFSGLNPAGNGGIYTVSSGSAANINANNQYGGNGQGNYLSVNQGGGYVDLAFDSNDGLNYFGFLWTAGDPTNKISLYSGTDLLVTYTTSHIVSILEEEDTLLALDGAVYDTADYFGKPVTGQNANEPYAYLHFFAGDAKITGVRIEKTLGGGNFENDNHSVIAFTDPVNTIVADTPLVLLENSLPVPEPSSALLLLAGNGLVLLHRRRRRLA